MIGMQWLRRLIRRNTNPIDVDTSRKWKQRLSIAYAFIAWNTFGLIAYGWYTGRGDWADYYGLKTEEDKMMPNNEYFARTLGRSGKTTLVKMKGFTVTENKDFDYDAEKAKEEQKAAGSQSRPMNMEQRIERRRRLIEEELARREKENQDSFQ